MDAATSSLQAVKLDLGKIESILTRDRQSIPFSAENLRNGKSKAFRLPIPDFTKNIEGSHPWLNRIIISSLEAVEINHALTLDKYK